MRACRGDKDKVGAGLGLEGWGCCPPTASCHHSGGAGASARPSPAAARPMRSCWPSLPPRSSARVWPPGSRTSRTAWRCTCEGRRLLWDARARLRASRRCPSAQRALRLALADLPNHSTPHRVLTQAGSSRASATAAATGWGTSSGAARVSGGVGGAHSRCCRRRLLLQLPAGCCFCLWMLPPLPAVPLPAPSPHPPVPLRPNPHKQRPAACTRPSAGAAGDASATSTSHSCAPASPI